MIKMDKLGFAQEDCIISRSSAKDASYSSPNMAMRLASWGADTAREGKQGLIPRDAYGNTRDQYEGHSHKYLE